MAKKDPAPREERDEPAPPPPHVPGRPSTSNDPDGFTHVKNAHATGLGAMGRDDGEQTGQPEPDSPAL